jgi:hypothetical protein
MISRTRTSIVAAVALLAFVAAPSVSAQVERTDERSAPAMAGAVPIERVISAVA